MEYSGLEIFRRIFGIIPVKCWGTMQDAIDFFKLFFFSDG